MTAHKCLAACVAFILFLASTAPAQAPETVRAIAPPAKPLPSEAESAGITRFSFVVYGDTRGRRDGQGPQDDHARVMERMLGTIARMKSTPSPVRFVLQTGDAVVQGGNARQWNVSFNPIVERLTKEADVPYFLIPGNHDVTAAINADAPGRIAGVRNYGDAMAQLIPPEGSARRLTGYPAFAFGYGNTFVLGIDSNIAPDQTQFDWAKSQLEGLDRSRYVHVFAFMHHPPFTSGPHGASIEQATRAIRSKYMPLFRAHHVKAVLAGHDHLFDHFVERYTDASGEHRMDLLVTGGGGAPIYTYQKEPETAEYEAVNADAKVRIEHLAKPGAKVADNPNHFVLIHVDGDRLSLELVAADASATFQPHGESIVDLRNR